MDPRQECDTIAAMSLSPTRDHRQRNSDRNKLHIEALRQSEADTQVFGVTMLPKADLPSTCHPCCAAEAANLTSSEHHHIGSVALKVAVLEWLSHSPGSKAAFHTVLGC